MAEIQNRWVKHLRNNSRQDSVDRNFSCPLCSADVQPDIDAFRAHVLADEPNHSTLTADAGIEEAFKKLFPHAPKHRSVLCRLPFVQLFNHNAGLPVIHRIPLLQIHPIVLESSRSPCT